MIDVRLILWILLIANILQIPQAQKFISWLWVEFKFRKRKAFRFTGKWSRRFYYFVKDYNK